jgi:uncharacterized protein YjbI with pentapeptide repeats
MGTERLGSLLTTAAFIFLLALVAVGLGALNIPFPEDQLDKRVGAVTELLKVTTTAFGGIAVLINAYYAAKRAEAMDKSAIAAEKNIEIGLKNAELTEERLITERFSKAIEQLGNEDNLQIRLGSIYALERIAKDSPKDYWPVMEVLTAFIREDTRNRTMRLQGGKPESFLVQTEVQAALTVLGRRAQTYKNNEEYRLDLSGTDLRGANLRNANLAGVNLSEADLSGAMLEGADLQEAILEQAIFHDAVVEKANLNKARLWRANFRMATLNWTSFQETQMTYADFTGAILVGADLQGANLESTIFEGAVLHRANLQDAKLRETNLYKAGLIEADLRNAKLWRTNLKDAALEKANLEGATFQDVEAEGTNFKDCNFAEVIGLNHTWIRQAITEEDELCRGRRLA